MGVLNTTVMLPLERTLLCYKNTKALVGGVKSRADLQRDNGPIRSVFHLKSGQKLEPFSQLGAVEQMRFGTLEVTARRARFAVFQQTFAHLRLPVASQMEKQECSPHCCQGHFKAGKVRGS